MKRLLVLVLLVPILAVTMISCDADMRSNIAGFMGGFGGNVYASGGLFEVDTTQATNAANTVSGIGTQQVAENESINSFGIAVTIPADVEKILKPQLEGVQKDLKNDLADAFNSTKQTDALLTELKKPVSTEQKDAAKGTITVFNLALDAFIDALADGSGFSDFDDILEELRLPDIGDGSTLTQGDLLNLQLMTNLISNTIGALTEVAGGNLDYIGDADFTSEENMTFIFKVIDDILFATEVAGNISSSTNFNFIGNINLSDLMASFGSDE